MRVLVIGATGQTGQIAVRRLLERGDDVTALARTPSAIEAVHQRLRVAKGEARDEAALERALAGQDAVLSAFGPRAIFGKTDLQEVFMRNLIGAMQKTGVKRLSNLSAWGAGDSDPILTWFARLAKRTAGDFFDDKERGEAILLASDRDFVNVRPARLTNGPARGGVQASLNPDPAPWLPLLTREDLAIFMIAQLTDDAWLRKSPLVWGGASPKRSR
jgi:uncharacterized protein YbjT (DUF2867 family)